MSPGARGLLLMMLACVSIGVCLGLLAADAEGAAWAFGGGIALAISGLLAASKGPKS